MQSFVQRVLASRMLKGEHEKARQIAEKLVSYKQQSIAIATRDATDLGLRVREASGEEAELFWSFHRLWVEHIIEYEALQPQEVVEPIEFRFGKGIVLTVVPREVINEARRVSSSPQGQ
jgi:hypothetical protein